MAVIHIQIAKTTINYRPTEVGAFVIDRGILRAEVKLAGAAWQNTVSFEHFQ